MVQAISACPGIIDDLMTKSSVKVKKAEIGVDEFIDGLIDMEAEKELAKVEAALALEASNCRSKKMMTRMIQVKQVGCLPKI